MNARGNTPLIKSENLAEPGGAEIHVKYEGGNPTGSIKDRMAREIPDALGGDIDEFIEGVGTGGDISGTHKLEGIGAGFVPSICRLDLADETISVRDEDAVETARRLAVREGIFGGTASGANVWAAIQRARMLGAGKKIVTIICDSGLKYLNADLYR